MPSINRPVRWFRFILTFWIGQPLFQLTQSCPSSRRPLSCLVLSLSSFSAEEEDCHFSWGDKRQTNDCVYEIYEFTNHPPPPPQKKKKQTNSESCCRSFINHHPSKLMGIGMMQTHSCVHTLILRQSLPDFTLKYQENPPSNESERR